MKYSELILNRFFRATVVFAIFFVTLFFSTYKLTESPPVWYDEGFYVQAAMNLVRHDVWGIQIAPHHFSSLSTVTAGFPLIKPIALAFEACGIGVLQARSVMVVFIVSLIAASFILLKREFGFYSAIGACLLLATFPSLYGDGKTVLGEVPGIFYLVIYLIFLSRWFNSNKNRDAIFAGIFFGLAVCSKLSFLIVGISALFITFAVLYKQLRQKAVSLVLFLLSFSVPIGIWAMTQFNTTDSFAIFFDTTFRHYDSGPVMPLLIKNVVRFFTESTAFYLLVVTTAWIIALARRWTSKQKIGIVEIYAFIFSVLNLGIFLLSPGWYRYFFPAQIVSLLFLPTIIHENVGIVTDRIKKMHDWRTPIVVIVICMLSVMHAYRSIHKSFVATYYHSTRTAQLTSAFAAIPTSSVYFIYNVPEIVIFLPPELIYYQYTNSHPRHAIGQDQLSLISLGVPDKIIVSAQAYRVDSSRFRLYSPEQNIANRYLILNKINR